MSHPTTNNGIHCNNCNYEGTAKTNSATLFLIFLVLLCASVFFLPLIIGALVFMAYIITKPAKKHCPECKSSDVRQLSDTEAGLTDTGLDQATTNKVAKTDDTTS